MIGDLKRRFAAARRPALTGVSRDPAAQFAYDLATKPPTKNVASVKAASDVFEANCQTGDGQNASSSVGHAKHGRSPH